MRRSMMVAAGLVAGLLAGCTEEGPRAPVAVQRLAGGAIALESISGAPEQVQSRVASEVAAQGAARRIAIVSRSEPSPYRVRGYLSQSGQNVAYVFDVFDQSNRRAYRVAGEEPLARAGSWDGVDEATARRIAANSMDQMAALMAAGGSEGSVAAAAPPAATSVASATPAPTTAMGGPYVPLPGR